jgi:curved DNA-binding protein CbpA/TPR repeat protein
MDPYEILGVDKNASQEEIKKAYRREAMKWHPDRRGNSAEARERFHDAAEAYRILSSKASAHDRAGRESPDYSDDYSSDNRSHQSDAGDNGEYDSADDFADTVFWDVMLDHAIKLAQTGLNEQEIAIRVIENGCPEKLATVIAEKAYNIHSHYATSRGQKRKGPADHSTFKQDRLRDEVHRAFLGGRNLIFSSRETLNYYLMVFNELRQTAGINPLTWINRNKRLMRILNFSVLLFAVILAVITVFPGPSEFKLLPDLRMLQIPFAVLALMFVWALYRKLWLFSLILWLAYLGSILLYNRQMPAALTQDVPAVLLIAAACYAPFVLAALLANYAYYLKAERMTARAAKLFDDHLDQMIWIKNRAGTSYSAALLFLIGYASMIGYVFTDESEIAEDLGFVLQQQPRVDEAAIEAEARLREAERFFEMGESYIRRSPPDYIKAEIAYSNAANKGSLLAAYRLGYLYYTGEGIAQNDVVAFDYFLQAIDSPLAFQPHSLQLTTEYLAEAYNNLGIMYQIGLGTRANLKKAEEMFNRGVQFGSLQAQANLRTLHLNYPPGQRRPIKTPDFDQ